jgi:hypothetical protein
MTGQAETIGGGRRGQGWRIALWGGLAALLALPAVAMRFTSEVKWDETDFILMGVLLGGAGLLLELAVRRSSSWAYRAGFGLAVLAAFLTIWVNLAVGMIGSEDNPYNLLFGLPPALAAAGALLSRLRPAGMAGAMLAAAVAQAAVGLAGLAADPRGGLLSAAFALLWLLSAALFRKSPRDG